MHKKKDPLIKQINYKDLLIALGLWYLLLALNLLIKELLHFSNPDFTRLFFLLVVISSRFLYLALLLFYLNSLYPLNFKELGFNFQNFFQQLTSALSLLLALGLAVIVFINLPLSYNQFSDFQPLYHVLQAEDLVLSIFPLAFLFLACLFIGFSQTLLLNKFIYELFNNTLFNSFFSLVLSSFFYSFLLLNFNPTRILVNFLAALINLLLYLKFNSLFSSSIFMAGFYAIYILYIYGWEFIPF